MIRPVTTSKEREAMNMKDSGGSHERVWRTERVRRNETIVL